MFSGGMPNSPAIARLRHRQALARRVDRQAVAVPCRDDGVRLHRVVILRRRLVGRVDPLRCRGEARLDVAVLRISAGLPTPTAGGTKLSPASRPMRGGQRLVARRQQRGAFGRGLQRLGDHDRDRLVGVAHLVVLQQVEPEHERVGLRVRIHPRAAACCAGVMTSTTPGCAFAAATSRKVTRPRAMLRDREHGIEHAGRVIVGRVAAPAPLTFRMPSRRVSGWPIFEPCRRWAGAWVRLSLRHA